jgi:hypothetical protein
VLFPERSELQSLPLETWKQKRETISSMVRIPLRGTAALLTAAVIVAVTLIWLPAYRLFFAVSIGIGVVIASVLHLWHRFRPVREEDIENKRPLGLS